MGAVTAAEPEAPTALTPQQRAPGVAVAAAATAPPPAEDAAAAWVAEYTRLRRAFEAAPGGAVAIGDDPAAVPPALTELRARIVHHHAHLVESVARRYLGSGEPLDDLIQEGCLGLLSALDRYDPGHAVAGGRPVKFSTYATHFVAGAIRHFLRDRGKIIKEPAWLHELSGKVNRAADCLTVTLGRAPETAEIARELHLTEEAVEEILQTRRTFQVAAFATGSDEEEDAGLAVGLVNPEKIRSDRYETLRLPIEDRIVLEGAMTRLKALEQKVLYEFFYQDLSQTEIARKMGISCNYVSHILKNSTGKLRRILGEADVKERGKAAARAEAAASTVTHPASGLLAPARAAARVEEELSRAARAGAGAALLFVHVDGMPAAGLRREGVWEMLGAAVKRTLRRIDVAGHCAPESERAATTVPSDDLLLLLPSTTAEQAQAVALRLSDVLLAAGAAAGERLTVSVGSALYPLEGRTLRDLLPRARAAALTPSGTREEAAEATPAAPAQTPLPLAAVA
jgi:RNA polymerase sigma-B factor